MQNPSAPTIFLASSSPYRRGLLDRFLDDFETVSPDVDESNLDGLPPAELAEIPTVCGSLREALDSLAADNAFLKAGDVFTGDMIDAYIELKMEEVERFEQTPHPVEFDMYYSV